jgi:hypothetical protein
MKVLVFAATLTAASGLLGQGNSDLELARQIAAASAKPDSVALVIPAVRGKVPLLLSWTLKPVPGVDETELYIGLADAFGQMETVDAIPFLLKNISLQRWIPSPNTWMKTPKVIEERFPAVAALIRIGPRGSQAVIRTDWEGRKFEERLAAVFVVSRVKGVPEAKGFLSTALGEANLQRHFAEDGLELVDARSR